MRIFAWAVRCAVTGLFIASCSGDHTSGSASTAAGASETSSSGGDTTSTGAGGGNAAGATVDMWCNTVYTALCDAAKACAPDDLTCQCYPMEGAANRFWFCDKNYIVRKKLEDALQTGTTRFDQARFDECLARLKVLSATGPACAESPWSLAYTICLGAFQGQLAPGAACGDWGYYWNDYATLPCKDGACDNGVCVAYRKLGDPCPVALWLGLSHADTLCNFRKQEWCHGDPDAGASGAGGGDGGTAAMGICAPAGDIGAPCHPDSRGECKSIVCDEATGTCVAAPAGQACYRFP